MVIVGHSEQQQNQEIYSSSQILSKKGKEQFEFIAMCLFDLLLVTQTCAFSFLRSEKENSGEKVYINLRNIDSNFLRYSFVSDLTSGLVFGPNDRVTQTSLSKELWWFHKLLCSEGNLANLLSY